VGLHGSHAVVNVGYEFPDNITINNYDSLIENLKFKYHDPRSGAYLKQNFENIMIFCGNESSYNGLYFFYTGEAIPAKRLQTIHLPDDDTIAGDKMVNGTPILPKDLSDGNKMCIQFIKNSSDGKKNKVAWSIYDFKTSDGYKWLGNPSKATKINVIPDFDDISLLKVPIFNTDNEIKKAYLKLSFCDKNGKTISSNFTETGAPDLDNFPPFDLTTFKTYVDGSLGDTFFNFSNFDKVVQRFKNNISRSYTDDYILKIELLVKKPKSSDSLIPIYILVDGFDLKFNYKPLPRTEHQQYKQKPGDIKDIKIINYSPTEGKIYIKPINESLTGELKYYSPVAGSEFEHIYTYNSIDFLTMFYNNESILYEDDAKYNLVYESYSDSSVTQLAEILVARPRLLETTIEKDGRKFYYNKAIVLTDVLMLDPNGLGYDIMGGHGVVTEYDSQNQILERREWQKLKFQGLTEKFLPGIGKILEQNYSNNILNGSAAEWGVIKNPLTNIFLLYKIYNCNYVDGKLAGNFISYYDIWTGTSIINTIKKKGTYKDGKLNGELIYYYENEQYWKTEQYENGVLIQQPVSPINDNTSSIEIKEVK